MLFHITTRAEWAEHQAAGAVTPASESSEGFVHASTSGQLLATADRLFSAVPDLLVLAVDPAALPGSVRFEDLADEGEAFPHVYGGLPLSAVVGVSPLTKTEEGFAWPTAWEPPAG